MDSIRLEILKGSHLEHFKAAKDFSMLPLDHPKRKKYEDEVNKLVLEMQKEKNNESK